MAATMLERRDYAEASVRLPDWMPLHH